LILHTFTMRHLFWAFFLFCVHGCRLSTPETVTFDEIWRSPFRPDKNYSNHFSNEDGEFVYILNKTAWAYFVCEYPEKVLENAKKHGANVIRVCLEGTPYPEALGYDLWPWGGTRELPDYTTFNEDYWDEVEKRMRLAGEHGIGIDLVLYFTLKPEADEVDAHKPYWDQAIRRLSRFSNLLTWEIMNEYIKNESFQDVAGRYFKENDPYSHPVCSSDGTTDDALWPEKDWMDLAIVHTCTGNQENYDLQSWYLGIAQNVGRYGKPAFNNESGREKRHQNDDPVHRRKQGWLFANSGVYWTWHSWDGCEGINDTTYTMEGWQYLPVMKEYYSSIPFWKLYPNQTAARVKGESLVQTTLTSPSRDLSVIYCCTRETDRKVTGGELNIRLNNGVYAINFYNPANMERLREITYTTKSLRSATSISIPEFTDDLLIEVRNISQREKTVIQGTE